MVVELVREYVFTFHRVSFFLLRYAYVNDSELSD